MDIVAKTSYFRETVKGTVSIVFLWNKKRCHWRDGGPLIYQLSGLRLRRHRFINYLIIDVNVSKGWAEFGSNLNLCEPFP